jgi:D-lactate dehydrogenase (cytochrome)
MRRFTSMLQKTDRDVIQSYFEDHSGLRGGYGERVVVPADEQDVIEYLGYAAAHAIPVTISGAGTGVTGGRVPFGGEILSMESMNRIGEIRTAADGTKTIVVGPGTRIQDLQAAVRSGRLMYAPDPTEKSAFVGGNVATSASGGRGLKYGSTRQHVRRLRLILSNGETLDIRRGTVFADAQGYFDLPLEHGTRRLKMPGYRSPRIKNAAGYFALPGMDLIDLFIGQEGTLGVITEIEVGLVPLIEQTMGGVAFFERREDAWSFVEEVRDISRTTKAVDALSLEYLDRNALALLRDDYPGIPSFAEAAVLFEQDATTGADDGVIDTWSGLFKKHGAPIESVWFGTTVREQETFREFRHRLPERVNAIVARNGLPKVGTDIAVPDRSFREMMQIYYDTFEACGIDHLIFGHIGESHLHANILPKNEQEFVQSKKVYGTLAERAVGFGGTVSAEHGIGKLKHHFLAKMVGPDGMREMARVKKALDPAGILGPGNVFPHELLTTVK